MGGKGGHGIGLTTLPPSCADCLEIWEPQPSGKFKAYPGLYRDYLYLYLIYDKTGESPPLLKDS
jgi:hypothetical protein